MTAATETRALLTARLVLIVLIGLLAAAGCGGGSKSTGSSTPTPADFDFGANNPLRADAVGDSITRGVLNDGTITSNNYPNILQTMLRGLDLAWRVNNRGIPGENAEQGAARLPGVLATDRPGFALLMEGTNNASQLDDPAFIVAQLQRMVGEARANKTIPVLGTIPPCFRTFSTSPYVREVIDHANTMIRTMANAEGVVLAEIFNGMNDPALFGVGRDDDPHHPTEQGYSVMAGIWFSAMQEAIPATATAALHPRKK